MMNEQAIIKHLKENKKNGVAFAFLPGEVRGWCEEHRDETVFHVFSDAWRTLRSTILCEPHGIYCLTEDYQPKSQFKPYLQEFDIDEDGCFEFEGRRYYYREDARFETENRDRFKGFGGWLCNDYKWRTYPALYEEIGDNACFGGVGGCDCEPALPTKIRFWRLKK